MAVNVLRPDFSTVSSLEILNIICGEPSQPSTQTRTALALNISNGTVIAVSVVVYRLLVVLQTFHKGKEVVCGPTFRLEVVFKQKLDEQLL